MPHSNLFINFALNKSQKSTDTFKQIRFGLTILLEYMNKGFKAILTTDANVGDKDSYHLSITFFVFQEAGRYISYCPSLDISSSGDTFNEALGNFYEMLQLHLDCLMEYGTLHEDLVQHGWTIKNKEIIAPTFRKLMSKPEMKKLMESDINFEKIVTPARIPTFA